MPSRPDRAAPPPDAQIAHFDLLLRDLLGLQFEPDRHDALADLLQRRADKNRMTQSDYLDALPCVPDTEIACLAEELTVTETSFFRNTEHMQAFEALLLADRGRDARILSAGCASGEEPYSLAMIAQGASRAPSIQAFDINAAALARAAAGRYSPWSLRQTPASFRARYFRPDGRFFALDDGLRAMVDFTRRNLAAADEAFWQPGAFDIIFCRNVLMYFAPDQARRAIARIARALAPGGYLFLGHAETLRGLSGDFHLLHSHGTFYYRLGEAPAEGRVTPAPVEWARAAADDVAWFDNILRASERVRVLTGERPPPPRGGADD